EAGFGRPLEGLDAGAGDGGRGGAEADDDVAVGGDGAGVGVGETAGEVAEDLDAALEGPAEDLDVGPERDDDGVPRGRGAVLVGGVGEGGDVRVGRVEPLEAGGGRVAAGGGDGVDGVEVLGDAVAEGGGAVARDGQALGED